MKNFLFFVTLVFLSAATFGQRVNFSGNWKLNEDKSRLGFEYSIAPRLLKVDHRRKTLELISVHQQDGQESEIIQNFTLDGEASENIGPMGAVTRSTASFDKKSGQLKIITGGSLEGMDYTLVRVLYMKNDQLVMDSEAGSERGSVYETFVFDRR